MNRLLYFTIVLFSSYSVPSCIFLCVFPIILTNEGCKKRCVEKNYDFKSFVSVSPNKDSVQVGDTIFIQSVTSTLFFDANSSSNIDFSGALNFGTALGIGQLIVGNDSITGAVNSFTQIAVKGNFSSTVASQKVVQVRYIEEGGNYSFTMGLIAQKKGIFSISLADATNTIHPSSECEKANISVQYHLIDQHLHYLQEIYYGGAPLAEIDKTHIYCFKVY